MSLKKRQTGKPRSRKTAQHKLSDTADGMGKRPRRGTSEKPVGRAVSGSAAGRKSRRGGRRRRDTSGKPVDRKSRLSAGHENQHAELKALRRRCTALEHLLEQTTRAHDSLRKIFNEAQSIAHLGTWEWDVRTGRENWSEEQYRLFGYKPDEIEPTHQDFLDLVHPDDRCLVQQTVRDAFDNVRSCDFEFRVVRRDGITRWLYACGRVYRDEKNIPVRLAGTNLDITEYKLAQEALRESEATARALLNAPTDSVVLIDRTGTILDINETAAKRLGGTIENLIGKKAQDLLPPEVAERRTRLLMDVVEFGRPVRFEDERGGLWFDTVGYPVLDAVGKTNKLALVARDITERKRAEEEQNKLRAQLMHAQKLESLGVMAGGIAHDFNNLLMAILGHADLALLSLPQESAIRSSVEEILKVSRRAADLTKQMLDYSGKGQFAIQPVSMGELIQEMTNMLKVSVSKSATLELNLARTLPLIEADPTQMRQIIMNLVINASEAVGETGGAISVSTGSVQCDRACLSRAFLGDQLPEGLYVYLEVVDTGSGMEEDTLARMFDPFFTTKFAGRGLGLAVVLGIVRSHRGAIEVRSKPGRGTTFRILFPASFATAKKNIVTRTKPGKWRGHGTVLLVDDEEIVRTPAKRMLELVGFKVLTAVDGVQALKVFKAHKNEIVCVVLDLTMPQMDGVRTLRELRLIRRDVPVILSSGYGETESSRRFSRKDVAGFLEKPYQLRTLTEKIRQVLAGDSSTDNKGK